MFWILFLIVISVKILIMYYFFCTDWCQILKINYFIILGTRIPRSFRVCGCWFQLYCSRVDRAAIFNQKSISICWLVGGELKLLSKNLIFIVFIMLINFNNALKPALLIFLHHFLHTHLFNQRQICNEKSLFII